MRPKCTWFGLWGAIWTILHSLRTPITLAYSIKINGFEQLNRDKQTSVEFLSSYGRTGLPVNPIISSKRSMQMFGRCSLEDMIVWTWENFFTWGYDTSLSLSAPLSQAFITKYSLQWQLWRILLSLVIEVQRSVKWPVPEGCHERWEICSAKCVGHPI